MAGDSVSGKVLSVVDVSKLVGVIDKRIEEIRAELSEVKAGPLSSHIIDPKDQPNFIYKKLIRLGSRTPEIYRRDQALRASAPGIAVLTGSAVVSYSLTSMFKSKLAYVATGDMKTVATVAMYLAILAASARFIDQPILAARQNILDANRSTFQTLSMISENLKAVREQQEKERLLSKKKQLESQINQAIKSTPLLASQFWRYAAAIAGATIIARAVARDIMGTSVDLEHQNNVVGELIPDRDKLLAEHQKVLSDAKGVLATAREQHQDLLAQMSGRGVLADGDPLSIEMKDIQKSRMPELQQRIDAQQIVADEKRKIADLEASGEDGTKKVGKKIVWERKDAEARREEAKLAELQKEKTRLNVRADEINKAAQVQAREMLERQAPALRTQLESLERDIARAEAEVARRSDPEAAMKVDVRYVDPDAPMNANQEERALWQALGKAYPTTLMGVGLVSSLAIAAETSFLFLAKNNISPEDTAEVLHRIDMEDRTFKIGELGRQIEEWEIRKADLLDKQGKLAESQGQGVLKAARDAEQERAASARLQALADIEYERIQDMSRAFERLKEAGVSPNIPEAQWAGVQRLIEQMSSDIVTRATAEQQANDIVIKGEDSSPEPQAKPA